MNEDRCCKKVFPANPMGNRPRGRPPLRWIHCVEKDLNILKVIIYFRLVLVAAVAEWYRHRIVAGFVTSSSPVPLKTRRVGQRCTLNLSRAEMSSRWCGVVVRRGGASSGVVHVT
ncbi:uncharacterized protein TNCV_5094661 [Trichonephila clavipes]|nr:uncharacterized protein TNCV_5094661 [Trichonephila clavipes]